MGFQRKAIIMTGQRVSLLLHHSALILKLTIVQPTVAPPANATPLMNTRKSGNVLTTIALLKKQSAKWAPRLLQLVPRPRTEAVVSSPFSGDVAGGKNEGEWGVGPGLVHIKPGSRYLIECTVLRACL